MGGESSGAWGAAGTGCLRESELTSDHWRVRRWQVVADPVVLSNESAFVV